MPKVSVPVYDSLTDREILMMRNMPDYVIDRNSKHARMFAPAIHNWNPNSDGQDYEVTVRDEGDVITVFGGNGLIIYAKSVEELPATMQWNLICVRASGVAPLYNDSYSVEQGLRREREYEVIPKEWTHIGWSLSPQYRVVVVPERELVSLQLKYNGYYQAEHVT